MFGQGYVHMDSFEQLAEGNYTAKIVKAEQNNKGYGDYIQVEVEIEGHPNCNPHIFLINDSPKNGYGSLTKDQALEIWCRNMTKFFTGFKITDGDFDSSHWIGKTGTVTVRQQKKNPQYNEIVPYIVKAKQTKPVETHTDTNNKDNFPEDVPDIF